MFEAINMRYVCEQAGRAGAAPRARGGRDAAVHGVGRGRGGRGGRGRGRGRAARTRRQRHRGRQARAQRTAPRARRRGLRRGTRAMPTEQRPNKQNAT